MKFGVYFTPAVILIALMMKKFSSHVSISHIYWRGYSQPLVSKGLENANYLYIWSYNWEVYEWKGKNTILSWVRIKNARLSLWRLPTYLTGLSTVFLFSYNFPLIVVNLISCTFTQRKSSVFVLCLHLITCCLIVVQCDINVTTSRCKNTDNFAIFMKAIRAIMLSCPHIIWYKPASSLLITIIKSVRRMNVADQNGTQSLDVTFEDIIIRCTLHIMSSLWMRSVT